ncbi:hypothetical protein HOY82DRAFT_631623 [Tuber indicum]|nr:hypothetical protein HOY82DRAFT_631623 [Tuber indicum]
MPPLTSHYQQPGELHHVEALVGRQVQTDTDPRVEETMAVRGPVQAAKEVRKEYFPGSGAPYYTYVKNEGSAILQNMQVMRREIAVMRAVGEEQLKKAEARAGEAVDRARQVVDRGRLSDDRAREAVARARVADDRAREVAESSQQLQPLYQVSASIRLRFLYNFGRLIGLETDNVVKAVLTGNKAAHGGEFVTDTRMMQHGDIADPFIFHTLYGISYKDAEFYTKSKSMIAMINTRATLLANPKRFTENWDQNPESQFKNQITNFINQSSEGDGKWQESQSPQSPSTKVVNLLVDSPSRGQPAHRRNNNKYGQPEDDAERYDQIGQPTGGLTSVAFLEALRTAFPRIEKKGKYGHYGQHNAEEWCDEETQDTPSMEIVETFVNLNYHISSPTCHLRDRLHAGMTTAMLKRSPSLDRFASYTETSRITRLPRYLTFLFVHAHPNHEINKKGKCNRKVIFPSELDATEFCTEVLCHKRRPTTKGLQDFRQNVKDLGRTRGHLVNNKCAAANPDDIGSQIVPTSRSGAARSPPDEAAKGKKKGKAMAKSKETEASLANREWRLIGELDPGIAQDEGCNLSGLYELMGVITYQGTSAISGYYSS